MKKIFILSMLIPFVIICSCQKQDSAVEQQLAQQKVEMDAREEALNEKLTVFDAKLKALDEKVKALAGREQANLNTPVTPADDQTQTLDPAQMQAERDRVVQQFSAQIRSQMPHDAKIKDDREWNRQSGMQKLQNQRQGKLEMSGRAVFPAPETTSPTPSPAVEAASPTPSSTPQ